MDIAAAGGIVFDADGRLLLVLRLRPPQAGRWTVPGGTCEPGESSRQACVRELAEETGLTVAAERWAGQVRRPGPDGDFVIDDYVCVVTGGTARAGDDAGELRWFSRRELERTQLVDGLLDALSGWGLLPD